MTAKILMQGAEATIFLEKNIVTKKRTKKSYRISELDEKIRKLRTRSEAKLLEKSSKVIPVPDIKKISEETKEIRMEFIEGKKLSEHLNKFSEKQQFEICKKIGENISKLHNENIVHGDLTTSNMIFTENSNSHNKNPSPKTKTPTLKKSASLTECQQNDLAKPVVKQTIVNANEPIIYFIDFGLGFSSHKFEDKAVDLHLLKQALEAKHFQNWEKLFEKVIEGYNKYPDSKKVLEQLKKVEKRGRYRH